MKKGWNLLLMFVFCAAAAAQDPGVQSLAGFELPEYDADGKIVRHIFGDMAEMVPGGLIRISNLRVDIYNNEQVEMKVIAPRCELNQQTKQAVSDGPVRIIRDNMVVTGRGFDFSNEKERIQIMHDTKVVLKGFRSRVNPGDKK
ncbi:MAG TPA: LPS export ABC transporter periplasmic protein LptC [Kiritimatiellia bacterium]|nr:LPS export ABC transporter periplasmic protein LptC [Kiritimatiellia bacterium]HNS80506.1 LPS export ABC transporter periplasmic protein LptC [Kiritimatiellia bacterium]HPA78170.1 LPS export ABC transporter periplasmic protein LptC [Kiritimatiellia bacterium]HQQ03905.1 LPS export ABC transporter periplasmic protein LptC [Kiritimatiellia bacterium]